MSEPLRAMARNLAAALARSYQAKRLYPEHHPERKKRSDQLHLVWKEVAKASPVVRIDFREARMHMGQQLSFLLDLEIHRELIAAARDSQLHEFTLRGPEAAVEALKMLRHLALLANARAGGEHPSGAVAVSPQVSAAKPVPTHGDEPVETLRSVWEGIAQRRQLDLDQLAELARVIARTPGDGLLQPVPLRVTQDPAAQTIEHTLNVARLVYAAARCFAPSAQAARQLLEAALLADIGMLSVPSALIARGERLQPAETRLLRQHPALGARWLLATTGVSELAAVVAFEHHLRSDGQGYPQPGRPWRLIAASQLYQVADVYAALRSPRPNRPALGEQEARALLRRLASSWLDLASVELLLTTAVPAGVVCASPLPQRV